MTAADRAGGTAGNFPKGMGRPAERALYGAGYTRLEQLANIPEADILKLHGMGPKAMDVLRRALGEAGLSFGEKS